MGQNSTEKSRKPSLFHSSVHLYFVLAVPAVLVLASIRLLMTPLFLNLEYTRPGFPEDIYGFTREERMDYAALTLRYLFGSTHTDSLRDSDGYALYTQREIHHLDDVRGVSQRAFQCLWGGTLCALALLVATSRSAPYRRTIWRGIRHGSILTLGLVGLAVAGIIIVWDSVFVTFHRVFFESGTWQFAYSDTLIRLFPEQFWIDAAIAITILTILGAFGLLLLSRWRSRQTSARQKSPMPETQ